MKIMIATIVTLIWVLGCDSSDRSSAMQDLMNAKNTVEGGEGQLDDEGIAPSSASGEPAAGNLAEVGDCADPALVPPDERVTFEGMLPGHHQAERGLHGKMMGKGRFGGWLGDPQVREAVTACRKEERCDLGVVVKDAVTKKSAEFTALIASFAACSSDKTCDIRELFASTLGEALEAAPAADASTDPAQFAKGPRVSWAAPELLWCYFDKRCDLPAAAADVLAIQLQHAADFLDALETCLADERCEIESLLRGPAALFGKGPGGRHAGMMAPPCGVEGQDMGMQRGQGRHMMGNSARSGEHANGRR